MPTNLESETKLKLQFFLFFLFRCLFNNCARLILTTYSIKYMLVVLTFSKLLLPYCVVGSYQNVFRALLYAEML